MESEGVSVCFIKLIFGKFLFCEIFFDNVKVFKENIVGQINDGWIIVKNLLMYECLIVGNFFGSIMLLYEYVVDVVGFENGKLVDLMF